MKPALRDALLRQGWDALYERFIPNLAPPNAKGERRSCSPFPDVIDKNPSFTVNIETGLWRCFKTERGGDYITFRAIIDADEFDDATSLAIIDYGHTERELLKEFGIGKPIDPEWIDECADVLRHDLAIQHQLLSRKPWNIHLLYQYKIGYSNYHHRFVIPIYDAKGKLVNCRMYRPGCIPKFVWLEDNLGGNFLWPRVGWNEKSVILVEGEPDTLSLRSFGFPAVTGTLGAGSPVPDGEWWRGKHIYVLMDADNKGQEATQAACQRMARLAEGIFIVKLPQWEGMPDKADISDYIMYLQNVLKYEVEQIQRTITQLLVNAEPVETETQNYDTPPVELSFREALSSSQLSSRVRFVARITAKSTNKYMLPTSYNLDCPGGGKAACKTCPMSTQFHGTARFAHDPRSKDSLKLIQVPEEMQLEVYCAAQGIKRKCEDVQATTLTAVDVECVIMNASASFGEVEEDAYNERSRREAYVIVSGDNVLEENREYVFEGFVYPHPKTQKSVFLVDRFTPTINSYENYTVTKEKISELQQFCVSEGQDVFSKLYDVAKDLSDSTTLIYGREDLHLAYRTVYHSILSFNLCGRRIDRGWIEALILGDTRCGKSEAFKQVSRYYGTGLLIDCKMQTIPGILGTVVQSNTGEYYVVAGLLPQQDGRVVCFDEFVVPKWSGQSILEVLSSTRSEGIVRISKAASAEFKARVRSIWLANPAAGRLISQCADTGCELIHRIITQPEDIARFDFALTVAQEDVPIDVINKPSKPTPPRYSKDAARNLLAWTHSRKPDQVYFTPDAETKVMEVASYMCSKYHASIPLVEIADQRTRIAKVAVSVAAQVFSSDPTGQLVIVKPEHVYAAWQLFTLWYDKPAMGYSYYSETRQKTGVLLDIDRLQSMFDTGFSGNGLRLAEELLRLDEMSERGFGSIVPTEGMFTSDIVRALYNARAVQLVDRGKKDSYEKTPMFVDWLRNYMRNKTY